MKSSANGNQSSFHSEKYKRKQSWIVLFKVVWQTCSIVLLVNVTKVEQKDKNKLFSNLSACKKSLLVHKPLSLLSKLTKIVRKKQDNWKR